MNNCQSNSLAPAFPLNIERAMCNVAARRNAAASLSNSARLLVAELLRVVCATNPRQSVRISNATLAEALSMSARTIHRIKAELESSGWITRHQIQSRRLGMQISDVTFTDKALVELELIKTKARKLNSEAQYNFPDDLQILVKMGMKPWALFALMKLARQYQARLGDVVTCIKDKLENIPNLYGYIKAVLVRGKGRDWAQFRSDKQAREAERARTEQQDNPVAPVLTEAQAKAAAENSVLEAEKKANLGLTLAKLLELKKAMPSGQEMCVHGDASVKFKRDADTFYSYKKSSGEWVKMAHATRLFFIYEQGKLIASV